MIKSNLSKLAINILNKEIKNSVDQNDFERLKKVLSTTEKNEIKVKPILEKFLQLQIDSSLRTAAIKNNTEITSLLLEVGANPNRQDKKKSTVVHYTAKKSSVDILELLYNHGADINSKDNDEKSPLYYATKSNDQEKTKFLLEKITSDFGIANDSLHIVARYGTPEVIRFALDKGFNLDSTDAEYKTTPLIESVRFSSFNKDTCAELLKYKPNLKLKNDLGETALSCAIEGNKLPIVKLLESAGIVLTVDDMVRNDKNSEVLNYGKSLGLTEYHIQDSKCLSGACNICYEDLI